jgi:glutathione S-transferase
MALRYAGIAVELREITLRSKPQHMLQISPKGTVPVLMLPDGMVIDESLDIMLWALGQSDPDSWLSNQDISLKLIAENDGTFKTALDCYKYASRFPEKKPETYRAEGVLFLGKLEALLNTHRYLTGSDLGLADIAIFPFIRQFASVDATWFEKVPYPKLRVWLNELVNSELFLSVMEKQTPWLEGQGVEVKPG